MQSNLAILNGKDHVNVKLSPNKDFAHIADHHMTQILAHEMAHAAQELPVVFIQAEDNESFYCVALLGLKEGENLLVNKENRWQAGFIPAGYTHHPLSLAPHPTDDSQYSITIDMDSDTVSETEGSALYNEDGSETEELLERRKALEIYYRSSLVTKDFNTIIKDLGLLEPLRISFAVGEDKRDVTGVFAIDEKKLNALSDEQFLDLRKKGCLAPIYAHLVSLKQLQRLINRIPATK